MMSLWVGQAFGQPLKLSGEGGNHLGERAQYCKLGE